MSAAIDIDPGRFVRSFVERRGGIAEEAEGGGLDLVLPPALAASLEAPEMSRGVEPRLGTALLERLVAEARRAPAIAAASIEGLRLKTEGVAALVEARLSAGNARLRAGDVARVRTAVLLVALRYEAISDEARGGIVEVAVDVNDLTLVPGLRERISGVALAPARAEDASGGAGHTGVAGALARHGARSIEDAAAPFRAAMERRLRRDEDRVRGYYDDLLRELDDPRCPRLRRLDPAAAAARRASERRTIEAERARRLEDAARRYALRIEVQVAAAIRLGHEEVACRLEVRRRTKERVIRAAWSPITRDVKPLLCERCAAETRAFEVCDDALHILCGACGAKACPVCARRGRG